MKLVNFIDIRDEAVSQIKAAFAENKKLHIAAHPGQFNEAEIKRLANQTPAVLTSLLRYADEGHAVDFVSWTLYRANSQDRLYDGALKIVSALIPAIRELDADWSLGGGERIEAECLYSGTLDQINVTLWAVKWKWHIDENCLGPGKGGMSLSDLDYFEGYDATHTIGDAVAKDNVNFGG
jgi:hypothetical protein